MVSGGQDDVAYVWSSADGSILLECTGDNSYSVCLILSVKYPCLRVASMLHMAREILYLLTYLLKYLLEFLTPYSASENF